MSPRSKVVPLMNSRKNASHAGLLLSRYLKEPVGTKDFPDECMALFGYARAANRNTYDLYQKAFTRWENSLTSTHEWPVSKHACLKTTARVIVGLGDESVLETGLRLHHTYGTPLIPGSSLKGLAAHYCDRVLGQHDLAGESALQPVHYKWQRLWPTDPRDQKTGKPVREELGQYHRTLFGTHEDAGRIIFHDAWICPGSLNQPANAGGLLPDVMTPHHMGYYGAADGDENAAPTDFDDPNPVHYLSVAGDFFVVVSCDVPGKPGDQLADLALSLLQEALAAWGVGGKTSSGYGRLIDKKAKDTQDALEQLASSSGTG